MIPRLPARAGLTTFTFLVLGLAASHTAAAPEPPPPAGPPAASSAPSGLSGTVTGAQGARIPLAIAPAEEGGSLAETRQMLETIRGDLDFSGYFELLDPSRTALVPPKAAATGTQAPAALAAWLTSWESVGADTVLGSRITREGNKIQFEASLFDARSRERIFWNKYAGDTTAPRRIAHKISDDIVRHLTGQTGIASSRIAYVARTAPDAKEIFLVDYDGERPRRLTSTGRLALSPVWSPEADRLAYISFRGRSPGVDIVNTDGKITRLPTSGGDLNSAPDWSADGRRMAYSSNRDGNPEIYVMDMATSVETRLTSNPAIDSSPCWSPNGRQIAFTSSRAGSPQIYLMDSDGLGVRRLTQEGDYNESAAWSPRGDRIAYVSRLGGRFDIFVHDLQSGTRTRLTEAAGNNENPRWSPDGRHLVFASDRGGSYRIYTMSADGTEVRPVSNGPAAYTPDWSH